MAAKKTQVKKSSYKSKGIKWIVGITGIILLIPLIAMQFSDEVNWGLGDFITAGTLLIGTGLIYEFASRRIKNKVNRTILGIVLLFLLAVIWIQLAAGII